MDFSFVGLFLPPFFFFFPDFLFRVKVEAEVPIASFFCLVFVFNYVIFALSLTDVVCSFVSTVSVLFQRVSNALSFHFLFLFAILYVSQLAYCGSVLCSVTEHPFPFFSFSSLYLSILFFLSDSLVSPVIWVILSCLLYD